MIGGFARAGRLRPSPSEGTHFRRPKGSLTIEPGAGSPTAARREARAAGRENLPTSDSTSPTEFETEIVRSFERLHRACGEPALAEVQRLTAQFTAIEVTLPSERDLEDRVVAVASDVDREVGSASELIALWTERERRLRDLRVFARENGLARDARYPQSRLLHLGLVAVLFLVEALANARFFSEASDFGLFGGFLSACIVALANVTSGFVTGWLVVPRLVHRRALARAGYLILLLVAVAFAGALNLAVAGYRDRIAGGVVAFASLHDLFRAPSDLSFTSALLLGLGCLAWALAAYKGFTFDDDFPGYGARDRAFRDADRKFLEVRYELVARVVARVQSLPADLRVDLGRGRATLARLDAIVVEACRERNEYETDRLDLRARCTALLKAWREENAFIRTDPAPAYFDEYPLFPTLVPEEFVRGLAERAARARALHANLEARAHGIVLENADRVTAALARVQAHVEDVMRRSGPDRPNAPMGRAVA